MSNYPTSLDGASTLYNPVNALSTKPCQSDLAVLCLYNDATLQLVDGTAGFAATWGIVSIENEIVIYEALSGNNLTTCHRGAFGTIAVGHAAGAKVRALMVAGYITALQSAVEAIEAALGITGLFNFLYTAGDTGIAWDATNHNLGIGSNSVVSALIAGRRYLTVKGTTGPGMLEVSTGAADALNNVLGQVSFADANNSNSDKRSALISAFLSGSTANNRGTDLQIWTRANGGTLALRLTIDKDGKVTIGSDGQLVFPDATAQITAAYPGLVKNQTLSADATVNAPTNPATGTTVPVEGQSLMVKITQDSAGGHAVTWSSDFLGGSQPGPDGNTTSIFHFMGYGSKWYQTGPPNIF